MDVFRHLGRHGGGQADRQRAEREKQQREKRELERYGDQVWKRLAWEKRARQHPPRQSRASQSAAENRQWMLMDVGHNYFDRKMVCAHTGLPIPSKEEIDEAEATAELVAQYG